MFCKNCGNEISQQTSFCGKCGESVSGNAKYPSSLGVRLLNWFLDSVISGIIFVSILVALWGIMSFLENSGAIASDNFLLVGINILLPILVGMSIMGFPNPLYYILFEGIWQRTPAKWITKTKVVNSDGNKPEFRVIVGRSFARLIPFEHFTFLIGKYPYGWHDSLSHTLVVPTYYSTEDIKSIDLTNRGKSTLGKIVAILIGILIALSIVGIISSVILASLNTAREKAKGININTQSNSLTYEVMQKVARDSNNELPMMLDSDTRWDSTVGIENGLIYNYTLVNYNLSDLEGVSLNELLKEDLINSICSSSDMDIYIKNGATLKYSYYDMNGLFIEDIVVNTGFDCKY
ncbi:MAG: RDD family protein [Thermodesulfobacteriota bacterium]